MQHGFATPIQPAAFHRARLAAFLIGCLTALGSPILTWADPLTLGATVSGQLTQPGESDQYTFSGTPGQRVAYDALSSDSLSINFRLVSPTGTVVIEKGSRADADPVTLLESGTYTLTMKGNGPVTGPYSFRLIDVGAQPPLPLNTVITRTLDPGNSAQFYTLNGTAGQRLYFDGLGSGSGAIWALYAPNNQQIVNTSVTGDFEATLAQTGTYVVAIWGYGSAPVSYSVQVVPFTITTNALTLGAVTTGSLTKPGDQQIYTFTGSPGQRVVFDALDSDPAQINARLISPGGLVIIERNSRNDIEPITLAESGAYSLVLDGIGTAVGSFNFRLLDLAAQPVPTLGATLSQTLTPGAKADIYRLDGTAGQRLYFDALGQNGGGATWYLYGPNNLQVSGAALATDFETVLPLTGSYSLIIWGSGPNPLPYSIRVLQPQTPATPLTLGASVTDSLANPGDQHLYTFAGAAGQHIYYDSLNRSFLQITCQLLGPNGAVVWDSSNASNDIGPILLTQTGAYTLVIDGLNATTGNYGFRLIDLASAPALSLGSVTSGQLNPASSSAIYQFNGAAGQRINFKNISTTANQATWRVVGPANQPFGGVSINSDIGDIVLPATGPYWLLCEGVSDNAAPLGFQFLATDKSDAPVTVTNLGDIRSGNLSGGQQDTLTFTAPAGTWVYYDAMDRTANNFSAELRDPGSNVIFSVGAGADSGPYVLPRSGQYTLAIRGGPTVSGTFKYRLLNWTGGTSPVALNGPVTALLDPGFRTDAYYFDGQAGQRLFYDALDSNISDSISVRLIGPDTQIKWLTGSSHSDAGPYSLPLTGRYYLIFESNMATPAKYTARLLDLNSQPDLPLNSTLSLTFDPGMQTQVYKFNGAPGQRFAFSGVGSNGQGSWAVYGPDNQNQGGSALTGYFEVNPQTAGQFILAIYGNSTTPMTGSFGVFHPSVGTTGGGVTITAVDAEFGTMTLSWSATPGTKYRVNYKTEIDEPFWSDLAGDVTASGSTATKTDPSVDSQHHRFYRIQVLP